MSLVDRWLSRPMSQRVAEGLRHENPQNTASFAPMSQKSQMSQAPAGTGAPVRNMDRAEPMVIAPVSWHENLVPPGLKEIPYDQPSPARRGWVERTGAAFLHFCVICGVWGSFGYGVTRARPGLWFCSKHRPKEDQYSSGREEVADEPR
jgi:hypothetical protein